MGTAPTAARRVAEVGERLEVDVAEMTRTMQQEMVGRIPDLSGDRQLVELLAISIRSNLETIVQVLRQVVDVADVTTPAGAREYARRLAQHGVSPNALVRAYRLGQWQLSGWALDLVFELEPDRAVALDAYRMFQQITFRYIDSISEQVLAEYQQERERWLSHRSTVRADVLDRLIAGEPVDVGSAEQALGIRLGQHHVGALLWTDDPASASADLTALEHLAADVGQALQAPGRPLFWPKDRTTAWAWFAVERGRREPATAALETALGGREAPLRVALGSPAPGAAGFRTTHLEARRAQQVALVARDRAARATSYDDPGVRAAALLASDLESTRRMVATALGGLAADTESAERLRTTLRVFLDEKGSYLGASHRLHLHKNTVKYRVDRAVAERGRPIDDDRLELELALVACRWLGAAVLVT
jgi:DNA-binding PucR family transcriptional regulator